MSLEIREEWDIEDYLVEVISRCEDNESVEDLIMEMFAKFSGEELATVGIKPVRVEYLH